MNKEGIIVDMDFAVDLVDLAVDLMLMDIVEVELDSGCYYFENSYLNLVILELDHMEEL